MLVLSRRVGEKIVINGTIVVTVVHMEGGKTRLGIEAPKEMPIFREEIYNAIRRKEALPKTGDLGVDRDLFIDEKAVFSRDIILMNDDGGDSFFAMR
ncbi:MAG TPA: carbon storage regulator CsrA [Gemmataceae bacterium]|jgi:carbon storage regulator